MRKPKMDEVVRQTLLQILEKKMKEHGRRAAQPSKHPTINSSDYFQGRVDGLNDAFRLFSTGEIET